LSELKEQFHEVAEATATTRLPNIDIEIIHRRVPHGDSEQFLINLQAVPSFEAFGRFLEGANPLPFGRKPPSWLGFPGWTWPSSRCSP
jgi:hypothetical protein